MRLFRDNGHLLKKTYNYKKLWRVEVMCKHAKEFKSLVSSPQALSLCIYKVEKLLKHLVYPERKD